MRRTWTVGGCEAPPPQRSKQDKLVLGSLNCGGGLHGRNQVSKEKIDKLLLMLETEKGMPAALALQHTGIQSLADAKRLTRRFGVCAVGVFALNPGKQNTYSTAVIFAGGAEDVVTVEAELQ